MTRLLATPFMAVIAIPFIVAAVAHYLTPVGNRLYGSDKVDVLRPPVAVGRPSMESPHVNPIAMCGGRVFVANTPAGTVDVIDARTRKVVRRIPVGVDPVGVAVRPDGKEVWVANHVSDSVSVIDSDPASPTHLHVIATVQEFDPDTKATKFDEPVGIAFAGNEKAYVALSSENQIAVIDVASRKVTKRLTIPAQEPRAIAVRNGRLYVIPFESNNQTQLSGGAKVKIDGNLVTFDAYNHSIQNNNVLSLGHVVDIVKHPKVPDRDLFVFDTQSDKLVTTVDTLGTLLYGLALDSKGNAFIAQTDARNDVNGRSGTKKHGLKEMENRAFLNRITKVGFSEGKAEKPTFFDLEPLPPKQLAKELALATPFAVQISEDDSTLIASAAASDKLFTVDTGSGKVLGRVEVGAGPRGIALDGNSVWVLNALANTVTVVDVTDRAAPKVGGTIPLEDPTHPVFRRGRIAFNTAKASTTGTFSCASCHPDGHTDQLLWVLETPIVTGGNQIMPRSTMPVRGLRDTAPFHWDGIPGDPYGGIHSASVRKHVEPNSKLDPPTSASRHLIDGGLATTMHLVGETTTNDEGKLGELTAKERDDMAVYLLGVPYPPAPKRAYTNEVSEQAKKGFRLFHIEGDHDPKQLPPNVCGNCHRMPFLVSTNTPGTGMDAPTWRGAQDRWLILPQGRLNIIDFDFFRRVIERGAPEREIWQFSWGGRSRFNPIWDMVLEMGTGYSGSFARQSTLNETTVKDEQTADLLIALEKAAADGAVVLECDGVLLKGKPEPVSLQFQDGRYVNKGGDRTAFTRKELLSLATDGKFVGTVTARHGVNATVDHPQPAIWTVGPIERQSGRQNFPILHPEQKSMTVSGRHFGDDARVFVDGRRLAGIVKRGDREKVTITLEALPSIGMHLLQVQVPDGMFSNDFIFHVAKGADEAEGLKRELIRISTAPWADIPAALNRGDLAAIKKLNPDKATANRRLSDGSTPLSAAALRGHVEIVKYLLELGADPSGSNTDGNTPLHAAAFLCREQIVKLLLEKGADTGKKNNRGETPIDVVSGKWDQGLADFYDGLGSALGVKLDLKAMEKARPRMAELLSNFGKSDSAKMKPVGDSNTELEALAQRLKKAVADGTMTAEAAKAEFEKAAKKFGMTPPDNKEGDKPQSSADASRQVDLKAIWAELQAAVKAGTLTQKQAEVAMTAVKKAVASGGKTKKDGKDDRMTGLAELRKLSKTLPTTSTGGDEEGPSATGLFGWAANATHRFMDRSHKGKPREVHGLSFRLDNRDHNSIGRTWEKVTIRIAHGDWGSIQHNKSKEFKLVDEAVVVFDKKWSFPTLKGFPTLKPDVWGGPQNSLNFRFDKPFKYNGKDAIFVEFVFSGGKAEDGRKWEGDLPFGFEYYLDSMPSVGGWREVEDDALRGGLFKGKARVEAATSYTAGGQSVWTTAPKGMPYIKWDFKK